MAASCEIVAQSLGCSVIPWGFRFRGEGFKNEGSGFRALGLCFPLCEQ